MKISTSTPSHNSLKPTQGGQGHENQGCIICSILPSGMGARGEHGDTLIYGISRDGSKNFKKRTCEHMILGQLTMGARQTKNASLLTGAFPWMDP